MITFGWYFANIINELTHVKAITVIKAVPPVR